MRCRIVLRIAALLAIGLASTRPLAAQSPTPERAGAPNQQGNGQPSAPKNNLQVLPKDLPWMELIETMEAFDRALGVHCEHCHVGQDPRFDFAADDKPAKHIARQMILLTRDINTRVPTAVNKASGEATRVECITCHRGVVTPRQLTDVLTETVSAKGSAAAIDQYREIRAKYYGGQSFDFSENGLILLAKRLNALGKTDEALDFLELNVQLYPKSIPTYGAMAQTYERRHDTDREIKILEKILEIQPDNAQAKRQLAKLTQSTR
jgi:tetratricopeptide (TPR) repeat protein